MEYDKRAVLERYATLGGYKIDSIEEKRYWLVMTAKDIADGYEFMLPYFLKLEQEIAAWEQHQADLRRAKDLAYRVRVREALKSEAPTPDPKSPAKRSRRKAKSQ